MFEQLPLNVSFLNRFPVVYFAHPISGLPLNVVQDYYQSVRERFGTICYVRTPMDIIARTDLKERKESFKEPGMANDVITNRDYGFVRECDVIFANLSKCTRPSIGSIMEIAWAYAYDKYIMIVMDEEGIHEHGMILGAHPLVYRSFMAAANDLIEYCKTGFSDPRLRSYADSLKYKL